ncbi:amino acid adenylation domain-containing protein [Actinocrispum sp. NPDC049592]|uniref:amino acid adenylation domain-containing protein n=1 Tax=Actinocrispum sp. NPDC049592 TaxID=3154835 RepID=UPI00341BC6EA
MDSARVVSFAQERLWFLDQLRPAAPDYLLPLALRVRGELDVPALTRAFQSIVDRHEVLRTRYVAVDGEPVALVEDQLEVILERGDDKDFLRDALDKPIDLETGPPFRLTLVHLGHDDHLLVFVVHHIAFDGWSWSVFARELAAGYSGQSLEPLAMQYAEIAQWQRDRFTSERGQRQLAYWRTRLGGLPALELPTDRVRPRTWDGAGDAVHFDLPAELLAEVDRFARSRRCTRYMVLVAVFQALLGRASGQTDFAIGTPVAGRTRPEAEALLGLFTNSLVLRADLSGTPTFDELLARVRATALGAFSNADIPFEQIVTEVAPDRDMARNPLFQVSFSLLEVRQQTKLPGVDVEFVETPKTGSPTELFLDLNVLPDGSVNARLHYVTALFDHARVERLADGFVELLRAVLAEPGAGVTRLARRLDLRPAGETERLLYAWNDTATAVPDRTITELFAAQALFTPDAIAIRTSTKDITYAQLDRATNKLAHHLRDLGVGPGALVAVLLDRGPQLLTAFLAVLKAGGAYVPIDPEYPAQRVEFMARDSGAQVMITQSALAGRVDGTARHVVVLDRDQTVIDVQANRDLGRTAVAEDLAYVIYTSGSTGTPKGVMVHHRALTNFVLSIVDRPGLRAGDSVMALTTISFDPSVLEMYVPLLVGATVIMADTEQARDPERMTGLIARTKPTAVQATPVTLRMLADSGWRPPAGLKVLSGGEKLPAELAQRLAADGATVWDLYGPTEATVWATAARLDHTGHVEDWSPLANYTIHLLDAHLEPVAVGSVGELYIGGPSVAVGYRRQPALTAERYVPDPYAVIPGGRLYNTGDLARRRPDGAVEILGRADRQVKIRGHRMEPGEIETALTAHNGVGSAVVHPTPTPSGELQLTAYLIPSGEAIPSADELRELLLQRMPDYMTPAAYVPMAAFPLTPNGKIDYNSLPLPEAGAVEDRIAPRTDTERVVADVWQEVLGSPRIGVHENFFDLGGHSLLATRVAVRLRAQLGIDVPVRGLFDHSTVATLAAALTDYPRISAQTAKPALTIRRRVAERTPS